MSFAMAITSFSSLNRMIGASGAKVSSLASFISCVTPVITVGSKNVPPRRRALTTKDELAALRQCVGHVLLHFSHCAIVDERTLRDPVLRTASELQAAHLGDQLVGERVGDTVLHIDAIGTDAGLTGIAELGDHCAFDGGIEIRVVEDDEGGVATEFQRKPLDPVSRFLHQPPPYSRRAREGDLGNFRVVTEFVTDRFGFSGDDGKSAFRYTCALGEDS